MRATFIIPGPPKGKGRPRFARRGKFVSTYTDDTTARYENLVILEFQRQCPGVKLEGPLWIRIRSSFPVPASWSKKRKAETYYHTGKPDADNILKIVCDSLNGIAFSDDSIIARAEIIKHYDAEPQVWVCIETIDHSALAAGGAK